MKGQLLSSPERTLKAMRSLFKLFNNKCFDLKRFPLGKRSSHTLFDFISLSEKMPYNCRWTKKDAEFCEEHPDESILIAGTFYVSLSKAENNSPYDPLELQIKWNLI